MTNNRIKYGDSRVIKITRDMNSDVNSFCLRKNEILKIETEKEEKSRIQKELSDSLQNSSQVDDNGKKGNDVKSLEKELEKITSDIRRLDNKIIKIQGKHKEPELKGALLKSFSNLFNSDSIQEKIVQEESVINSPSVVPEISDAALATPVTVDTSPTAEVTPTVEIAEPVIADEPVIPEVEVPLAAPVTVDTPPTAEVTPTVEIAEPVIADEPVIPEVEVPLVVPVTVDASPTAEATEPVIADEPVVTKESSLISELETTNDDTDHGLVQNDEPLYEFIPQEEFEQMWDGLQNAVPTNGEEKETVSKVDNSNEDDLNDLTKYTDYNDYVFAFAQNYYGKEALTPDELDKLAGVTGFLNEDTFDIKRGKQYMDIVNQNRELKDQLAKLDDNYRHEIENISADFTSNINELKEIINNTKKELEAFEKLNENLETRAKDLEEKFSSVFNSAKGLDD